jgi:phenylalanyl-tRNA synthetase alpha chain
MKLFENTNPINVSVPADTEEKLRKEVKIRTDAEGLRLNRFLELEDLTKKEGGPIAELVRRIRAIEELSNFDHIESPEIVRADESFDLFNFPSDHPARSKSDTYFVNDEYILRTHTTIMWLYYLRLPEVQEKIKKGEPLGLLAYGKVYRKDEIDRFHLNVFHQMDGLLLFPNTQKTITQGDLENILSKIAIATFGESVVHRFNTDTFPYTDPSVEMEIQKGGEWLEVLGGGLARPEVLEKLGLSGYNGWAFGFGLERLAMISMELPDIRLLRSNDERVTRQLVLGNKFKEVSKYPPITRDISFIVPKTFEPNQYFDLIRDEGGDLVEAVSLLDKYADEKKFGADRISYTYRIVYRSNERTLTSEEVDKIQSEIYKKTAEQFSADLR